MKKIGAYRQWMGLVMVMLVSLHISGGLRFFCPTELRSLGIDIGVFAITAPGYDSGEFGAPPVGSQSGTSKCNCKKQKKCPIIPRAAITLNPSQRFNQVQGQFKSVCCYSFVSHATDFRFATGSGPPLMELALSAWFCSPTPLVRACVLLI
jgi:hypothetical protein